MPIDGTDGETGTRSEPRITDLALCFLLSPRAATQGLDDLGKRCQKYREAGARFAKWYALIAVIRSLARSLARLLGAGRGALMRRAGAQ